MADPAWQTEPAPAGRPSGYRPMTAQEFATTVGQSGDALRPYPRPPAA